MVDAVIVVRDGPIARVTLKKAGIGALVFHFLAFLLIFPVSELEVVPLDRTSATVVKRYSPPAPPAKSKKTKKKKTSTPIPIPDPTPDDPEPIVSRIRYLSMISGAFDSRSSTRA